jgi:hypothetical protein
MNNGLKRRARYEDLDTVPPTHVGEIVDGVLYVSPRLALAHTLAAAELYGELRGPFRWGQCYRAGWLMDN